MYSKSSRNRFKNQETHLMRPLAQAKSRVLQTGQLPIYLSVNAALCFPDVYPQYIPAIPVILSLSNPLFSIIPEKRGLFTIYLLMHLSCINPNQHIHICEMVHCIHMEFHVLPNIFLFFPLARFRALGCYQYR